MKKKENNGYITQIFDGTSGTPISGLVVCPNKLSALVSYKKFLENSEKDDSMKVIAPYSKLVYHGFVDDDFGLSVCNPQTVATAKTVENEINGILSVLDKEGI